MADGARPTADADPVLERLVAWGRERDDIRAMFLTSSRARPDGPVDDLSDYDVVVAADDPEPYATDDAWHEELGRPLARWGDEDAVDGHRTVFRGVVYDDGTKIDFTIWPRALLAHVASLDDLPAELDAGYLVLFDEDGATARWRSPTYRAYVPERPSADSYRALVEEFWWDVSYVAKSLWRGELLFARSWVLGYDMQLVALGRMLEWHIEIAHDWSLPLGVYGRQLDRYLTPALYEELRTALAGPTIEETWEAVERTCGMFRRIANEVGDALGFAYPSHVDERMSAHLREIRARPPRERPRTRVTR